MLPLLFFFVALAVVGVVFENFTIRRDRRADVESGETPSHSEICGARIDQQNWSMPFVRLTLYPTFAVISYAKKIVLPYDTIDRVEMVGGILGRGVRLYHHQAATPEQLIIWSSDIDGLQTKLAALLRPRGGSAGADH